MIISRITLDGKYEQIYKMNMIRKRIPDYVLKRRDKRGRARWNRKIILIMKPYMVKLANEIDKVLCQ